MSADPDLRRKRIAFDAETWHALHRLSLDSMRSLQELADEAFGDLHKKHRRPVTLREALKESVRMQPANDQQGDRASVAARLEPIHAACHLMVRGSRFTSRLALMPHGRRARFGTPDRAVGQHL